MHKDTYIMSMTTSGSSFRRNHYLLPADSDYMQRLREKVVVVVGMGCGGHGSSLGWTVRGVSYGTVAAGAQCVAVIVPANHSTESDLLDYNLGTYLGTVGGAYPRRRTGPTGFQIAAWGSQRVVQ